ncbi:MAG: hypothetical protein ACSHXH_08790 [Marivita sp.]|uniref:hypothetical protein n=1 Tax=Marivita sp. TaxID=2003365 RepID=UPI003EF5A1F0
MIRAALALICLPALAQADLWPVPFDALRQQPHLIESFDSLPATPEPGIQIDQHWRAMGLSLAEHLAGQDSIDTGTGFDSLTGLPSAPLRVQPGLPKHNLSIAAHVGFGSNALFPVGPKGIAHAEGRGEGSVALVFDDPQFAIGLKLHAEYPDPLGQRPPPGTATLTFYAADARPIARVTLSLDHGVQPVAWRSGTGIAAITIENTDPGGIALDDILYAVVDLAG